MKHYRITRQMRLPEHTVVYLTSEQAIARGDTVRPCASPDWYTIATLGVYTQPGEVFIFAEVPKVLLHGVVPLASSNKETMSLSTRQQRAWKHAQKEGGLTLQAYQALHPGISRRTLQRDIEALLERGTLSVHGTGARRYYRVRT